MGKLRAAEDSPEWLRDLFEALREDDEDVVERIVKASFGLARCNVVFPANQIDY